MVQEGESAASAEGGPRLAYPFASAAELLAHGRRTGLGVADLVTANEAAFRPAGETVAGLDRIFAVMTGCIDRGCKTGGVLPGGLNVVRRAPGLAARLAAGPAAGAVDPLWHLDWVSLFALAVNEENAAGGRVVTAPTNGAAGVIPAVATYYRRFLARGDGRGRPAVPADRRGRRHAVQAETPA